ncbi:hypothetical protein KP509_14G014000 [Ceratopteris richardii]|uniref:Uncharacterized protein n=1 Tax=Ceratopteris richardii TaxID=49495 RepID=A0A8T2TAU0_CERRI|nr:hypothetical protein KP509_14G014000 [Ceratopteris richardii]
MMVEASPLLRGTEGVPLTAGVEVWRIPQGGYVDAVRWMPPATAWHQSIATALWDPDDGTFKLQLSSFSFEEGPSIQEIASWELPERASVLKTLPFSSQQAIVASASFAGTMSFIITKLLGPDVVPPPPILSSPIHDRIITGIDLQSDTHDCISVGEDGKINLTQLTESHLSHTCLIDNHGITSFMDVCWSSPAEFVTAGLGFSLQWWDHRRSGGPVQVSNKWTHGRGGGFIHMIDVHPSRKHVCVVGGSNGVVLAWDLRWQKEPIQLCGISDLRGQPVTESMVESDVWEVKFDPFSLSGSSSMSSKVPPVMICSEDGILGVLEAGEAPWEILAEPCAINTLDINPENFTDVICGLEFESLLYVKRSS